MLVIRMQRTGRKGHAQFRVVVQDSRRTPTSGKIVAALGSYNPHSKQTTLDKEKAVFYLEHGAQPSERVARLLKSEGVKLPAWVELAGEKQRIVRNADKRRSTRPAEPVEAAPEPAEADDAAEEAPAETAEPEAAEAEAPAAEETSSEESASEEPVAAEEAPAEETAAPEEPAAETEAASEAAPEAEEPAAKADEVPDSGTEEAKS
jgi:small subunit ribosomal protein S16